MAGRRVGTRGGGVAAGRTGSSPDTEPGADWDGGQPADPESAARNFCLKLLTARSRSRAELAAALARKGVSAEIAHRVLDRLGEVGLVDDAAYAEMVVRSGRRHRSLGRRALSAELRRRGVDDDTAGEAIATIGPDDEERAARALVERRLRAMSALDEPTRIRRLTGLLARRGYPEGLAYRVVREAVRDGGSSAEFADPEHVT